MQQQYITTAICHIPISYLAEGISDLIEQTVMDYGKTVDTQLQMHMAKRLKGILLLPKYKNWQWREVMTAFERGKIGKYQGESRASVASFERWLDGYNTERMRSIEIQHEKDKAQMANTTKAMLDGHIWGDAISWHLFECTKEERLWLNKRYEGKVVETIVDCMKQGISPRKLLTMEEVL